MTSKELEEKLVSTGKYTPEKIEEIVKNFETSVKNRNAHKFEFKSVRSKIHELMADNNLNYKDCRFFTWYPGLGIFVRRRLDDNKATVSFSFLNPNDIVDNFKFDHRKSNYYALLNYVSGKYTYEVDWKGRSEFAIYDAFVQNHYEFPGRYKKLIIMNVIASLDDFNTESEQE